jgi:hypothetical protein
MIVIGVRYTQAAGQETARTGAGYLDFLKDPKGF